MEIKSIETMKIRLPLAVIVRDRRVESQSFWGAKVVVKVTTDEGITGFGVADITIRITGQTATAVTEAINKYYGPVVIGQDPYDVESILEKMDSVLEFRQSPMVAVFARSAIDLALYDIMGKACGVPVHKLMGGCYRDRIPASYVLYLNKPEIMAKEAMEKLELGYKDFKLKIGLNPEDDLKRLKAVREAVGDDINLLADVNGAWNAYTAIKAIKRMERYDLAVVEQPVPGWDIKGLVQVRKHVDTPIMVDESLYSIHDAFRLIESDACDILNLKLCKLGGLYYCKKVATVAESANIPCFMGSYGESDIGAAACAHLMASTRNFEFAADGSIGRGHFKDDIGKEHIEVKDGFIDVPKKPGLGVELDETKVKKYQF